ncbi:MAG: corrinoid protein [Bacilli bacterium]|jgi:5-methyltetrahydrofolate--homocysteine methyltransferase|nr:corrinoid protein [Bacilli bacterium]
MIQDISVMIQQGKAKEIKEKVQAALDAGYDVKAILEEGLIAGMSIVGARFKNNEIFVPQVLISARAMNWALEVVKPYLNNAGIEPIGKALIGTVRGDLHDIGKNLVKMMLEGQGIACIDLGVDVREEQIVEAVHLHHPDIICLSALLTTTMLAQKSTIEALKEASLRDGVWVMVGGAPVTQEYAKAIGADFYSVDAASAASGAKEYLMAKRANR